LTLFTLLLLPVLYRVFHRDTRQSIRRTLPAARFRHEVVVRRGELISSVMRRIYTFFTRAGE
jgi:hypothetical protein